MNDITGDMGISHFMKTIGLHDNRLVGINITNGDLEVRLDDLYANVHNDGERKAPGSIIVRSCNWISCDNNISDWIVDGDYSVTDLGVVLRITLNLGTVIELRGTHVEVHQDETLA